MRASWTTPGQDANRPFSIPQGLDGRGERTAMGLYRSTGGKWDGVPSVMFEYDLTIGAPTG